MTYIAHIITALAMILIRSVVAKALSSALRRAWELLKLFKELLHDFFVTTFRREAEPKTPLDQSEKEAASELDAFGDEWVGLLG